MNRFAAIGVALSLLGATPTLAAHRAAPSGEQQLAKIVGDRTAGRPVNCINLHDIGSSRIVDGTAIVYEGPGGRLYVNRPHSGANTLRNDDILVTKSWTDQLCNVDVVRLVSQASRFEHGFVGLGTFVPYDRPARTRHN